MTYAGGKYAATPYAAPLDSGDPSDVLAASLPALTANLAGTYTPAPNAPANGVLAATIPALTANLAGTYVLPVATGSLAATIPALTANLTGTAGWTDTDLTYSNDGYNLIGDGVVTYDPPVDEPSAALAARRV